MRPLLAALIVTLAAVAAPGLARAGGTSTEVIGTVLFETGCDPVGGNPNGNQLFAMRPDGSGLRQVTATRGMTVDPDGTVHVEIPGPFAYSLGRRAATPS